MYRMTKRTPLATGQQYGAIIKDGELSATTIQALLSKGILARVTTPPLSELSECWEKRAEKLRAANVRTIDDLIQAKPVAVARAIQMTARTVRRWQQEAVDYLNPRQPKKGK